MRVAVVGSRSWYERRYWWYVQHRLARLFKDMKVTELVSGGAGGIDSLAEEYATLRGIPLRVLKPDWKKGKRAGPERNSLIVESCDLLVAFWDGESRGTLDSIRKAEKADKLLAVYKGSRLVVVD